jgi:hypothetical protein
MNTGEPENPGRERKSKMWHGLLKRFGSSMGSPFCARRAKIPEPCRNEILLFAWMIGEQPKHEIVFADHYSLVPDKFFRDGQICREHRIVIQVLELIGNVYGAQVRLVVEPFPFMRLKFNKTLAAFLEIHALNRCAHLHSDVMAGH